VTLPADERARLAERLAVARADASPIDPLTDEYDLTVADAYAIQSRTIDRRTADGGRVVGHKIGLTNDAIQTQLGVDEPDFGVVTDDMLRTDGRVPADELVAPRVEPEVGVLLGRELTAPVTRLDVLDAATGLLPVIEVIDSRIRDWEIDLADTVADNASAGMVVAGADLVPLDGRDLSLEGVKLYRNGTLERHGVGAAVLGHPLDAVVWLVNKLGEFDRSVPGGSLVLSGSMTAAVDVAAGDSLSVEFASLGTLQCAVE
jgi:2-keto-4-pentenoate hydratase